MQQKRTKSYAKDRRSTYGNNAKAAQSSASARKRQRSQAERRLAKQVLGGRGAVDDGSRVELMLAKVNQNRRKAWHKEPDEPLRKARGQSGSCHSCLLGEAPR